ncbi:hypothetical protein [Agromyces laixinhei]|uniref:hypothetical protein n=1 Tax=Agromyces laixinhei TaxID=2585717 RepID=UPI0012ECE3B9|nr:hypothetical protein [Agromyces laixinhei]
MVIGSLVIALTVVAALSVLQVLAASGRPVGQFVWGGAHRVLPRRFRIGSAVSILLYAGFAALLLSRAAVVPGGESTIVRVLTWVLFGYFALGMLLNAISRSRAERFTMAPACAVLAVTTLVIALS